MSGEVATACVHVGTGVGTGWWILAQDWVALATDKGRRSCMLVIEVSPPPPPLPPPTKNNNSNSPDRKASVRHSLSPVGPYSHLHALVAVRQDEGLLKSG